MRTTVGASIGIISAAPLEQLLLDTIATQPTGAYSTRKIKGSYSGSALRVRRSSDNAEQDIVFVSNELDTATLLSFCSAGDGFIAVWYDQSGNGRNLRQTVDGSQPQIVASGSLVTSINSNPAIQFSTVIETLFRVRSEDVLTIDALINANSYTYLAILRATAGQNNASTWEQPGLLNDTGGFFGLHFSATTADFYHFDTGDKFATRSISYPSTHVGVGRFEGTTISGWLDGGTAGTIAAGNVGSLTGDPCIGGFDFNSGFVGQVNECIIYDATLSDGDVNTLGTDMATRAGTSWTSI